MIRNANQFGRGRKRAIEDIESWVRDDYAAVKVAADEYDLRVPYETERELDDRVDALLDDIHRTAGEHHCFSESCACLADSDQCWS
ncbi:hypothetical protein [Burkholderia cepacia]|uniref:hypothetical protein n=1 Tax=Burkholderia cepacia TaxID=292 RepID=UPI001ABA2113|nr:hypothetical protein [Burkholderia cepacia]